MTSTQRAAFGVDQVRAGEAILVDRACGACATCAAGARQQCSSPVAEGRALTAPFPQEVADTLLAAALAVAALAEAPQTGTVVVVTDESSPLAVLARAVTLTRVLVAPDLADAALRAELGRLEPSGRARVVVAGGDVRAAVRAVRRGGHVCVGDPALTLPSVTELVQREVTLVGPRDAAGVLTRVSPEAWSAVVAAAAA